MDDVIAEVQELLAEVEEKIEELRTKVNGILAQVPGWLDWVVDKVRDGWNEACQKMAEFWDWFTDKLAEAGDMGALERAALSWNTDVGGPASDQSQLVDDGDIFVDDRWTGDAAERYKQKVPEQRRAMDAIRNEFAKVVSGALDAMRGGISAFWWGVVGIVVGLIVAIVGATTATGTIIGLPAVPVMIVTGVVIALASLAAGVAALNSAAASAKNSLNQAASYGLKSWPPFALT
jgi:hypothetical protein